MPEGENQKPGAVSGNEPTPQPAPTPAVTEPKLEFRDGAVYADGKKMVKESDLIAAKQSLEGKLETQQTVHNEAIDAVNLELSAERQKAADLNAKLQQAQDAQGKGAVSDDEIARIKQERDDALAKVETLTTEAGRSLELRKQLLIKEYPGVTAQQLENKTMQELDSLEEALKAVAGNKPGGVGPYAVGAGAGGATTMTEMDRAKKVIETTPHRGVREPEPAQK
jgi:hypothetical protein